MQKPRDLELCYTFDLTVTLVPALRFAVIQSGAKNLRALACQNADPSVAALPLDERGSQPTPQHAAPSQDFGRCSNANHNATKADSNESAFVYLIG